MKGEKRLPVLIIVLICCLLPVMPFQGYAADLTISDITTATGDFSVSGIIHATSLGGDGSALTNVTASGLSCTGCVTPLQLNFTPGTVTSVGAGTGLTGGTITTTGTLNVNFGGNGAASTVSHSDHSHDIFAQKYAQVRVVDAMGRGDYLSPVTAMNDVGNWCGIPSELNPCMVKIMPGFYDVSQSSVTMLSYVDIEGSGENITIIEGNVSSDTAGVVNGAGIAEIRFLTVRNRGGGFSAIAIYNASSPKITNVTVTASGGTTNNVGVFNFASSPAMSNVTVTALGTYLGAEQNYGVNNYSSSSPTMINVTVTALGGSTSVGIRNITSSSPTMSNVIATAWGGTINDGVFNDSSLPTMSNVTATALGGQQSTGVNNSYSSPTMTNVTASASGGTINCGVSNDGYSSPTMTNVTATATAGTYSYGVRNRYYSSPSMSNVTITASGASQYNYGIFNEQASTPYLMNITSNASDGAASFGILNAGTGGNMTVDHCRLSGQTSIRNDNSSATIFIGSSKLNGDVLGYPGTIKCVGVYNGSYSAITCP